MKRALKYLLFFLMILVIGSAMYIATLNGSYDLKESRIIKVPAEVVFKEVNDFRSWNKWAPCCKSGKSNKIKYSDKTIGLRASLSWESESEISSIENSEVVLNEKIIQQLSIGTINKSECYWIFKKVPGGTEVTWGIRGENSFKEKIYWLLNGGVEKKINPIHYKGLEYLDQYCIKKIEEHSFTLQGLTNMEGGFYIYQSTATKLSNLGDKKSEIEIKLFEVVQSKALLQVGDPFVIFHKLDKSQATALISVCIPVQENNSIDETVLQEFKESQRAFKTILKGDYKYIQKAIQITYTAIKESGYEPLDNTAPIGICKIDKNKSQNPAEWVTYIFIPIK